MYMLLFYNVFNFQNLEYTKLGIILNRKLSRTARSPNEVILIEGLFSAYIYKPLAYPLN
jgi:hypothetical protein